MFNINKFNQKISEEEFIKFLSDNDFTFKRISKELHKIVAENNSTNSITIFNYEDFYFGNDAESNLSSEWWNFMAKKFGMTYANEVKKYCSAITKKLTKFAKENEF